MVVAAQHELDTHLGEGAENLLGVLESVALRQLALHGIVVHDDDPRIARRRSAERPLGVLDLVAAEIADDGDVAHVPGERAARYTLGGVESDEG